MLLRKDISLHIGHELLSTTGWCDKLNIFFLTYSMNTHWCQYRGEDIGRYTSSQGQVDPAQISVLFSSGFPWNMTTSTLTAWGSSSPQMPSWLNLVTGRVSGNCWQCCHCLQCEWITILQLGFTRIRDKGIIWFYGSQKVWRMVLYGENWSPVVCWCTRMRRTTLPWDAFSVLQQSTWMPRQNRSNSTDICWAS